MESIPSKASLVPARQRLIELMQQLHFGRIENLVVRHGDPVLDPPPRRLRDIKLGGLNGPRPEHDAANFKLKSRVSEFFACLDDIGDGIIQTLEVKDGLPFLVTVAEAARG